MNLFARQNRSSQLKLFRVWLAWWWLPMDGWNWRVVIRCQSFVMHTSQLNSSKLLSSLFLADSRQDLSLYVKRLTSGIRLFEPPLCIRLSPCGQKSKTPPPPQRALASWTMLYCCTRRGGREMNFPVIENLASARNICAKTMMCHVCPCTSL